MKSSLAKYLSLWLASGRSASGAIFHHLSVKKGLWTCVQTPYHCGYWATTQLCQMPLWMRLVEGWPSKKHQLTFGQWRPSHATNKIAKKAVIIYSHDKFFHSCNSIFHSLICEQPLSPLFFCQSRLLFQFKCLRASESHILLSMSILFISQYPR